MFLSKQGGGNQALEQALINLLLVCESTTTEQVPYFVRHELFIFHRTSKCFLYEGCHLHLCQLELLLGFAITAAGLPKLALKKGM